MTYTNEEVQEARDIAINAIRSSESMSDAAKAMLFFLGVIGERDIVDACVDTFFGESNE